jgi:molybdenum cofactor biosynthesis enzyme MoaA
MELDTVKYVLDYWIKRNLKSVRFSGGEPTYHPDIFKIIEYSKPIENIAISSNGSRRRSVYEKLLTCGVNDFSISLDACCASDANVMSGKSGYFDTIVSNIKFLSKETYVTVGIVFTDDRADKVCELVEFADSLGVSDIRIISAAQYNGSLYHLEKIKEKYLKKYPILKYRVTNLLNGRNVRGLTKQDSHKCYLVEDDYAIAGKWHFPCVIYMREGGEPIGEIGENMQSERIKWLKSHDTHKDKICVKNCLDCLVDYNNLANKFRSKQ